MLPRSAALVCAALLAVGALAGCGARAVPRSAAEVEAEQSFLNAGSATASPTASAAPTTTPAAATVTMVAVGDAYTSGTAMGGLGDKGWAALVGAQLGWKVLPLGVEGSGYLSRGKGTTTFGERVPAVVAAAPQVVIVWGARNDVGERTAALRSAARQALTSLKTALPNATIVVIGPAWVNASPPASYRNARDAEKQAAADAGLAFVDPLTEDWFDGAGYMDPDGVHPTDAGFAHMSGLLVADLRKLGVPTGTVSTSAPATSPTGSATGSNTASPTGSATG